MDRPPQPFSFPQVSVMLTVKELGFDGDPLAWGLSGLARYCLGLQSSPQ